MGVGVLPLPAPFALLDTRIGFLSYPAMRYKGRMSKQMVKANWPMPWSWKRPRNRGSVSTSNGAYPSISDRTEFVTDHRARSFVVLRFSCPEEADLFRRRVHGEVYDPGDERWLSDQTAS